MLTKTPVSTFKRALNLTLKAAFLVEAAGFAVSFGVWYKLNTDREFRLYMFKNHSWALEGYYAIGEKIADQRTRQHDLKVWTAEGKI